MKRLRESIGSLGAANPNRVDREAGVIKGVKIVGTVSRNKRESRKGRRYTRHCLESAQRLYEGLKVRSNHPSKAAQATGEERKNEDVLGQLRNVRVGHDGLYGDLHYLKSHPLAERLCEAAERMPTAFGLSHDVARWKGDFDQSGTYVIEEIYQVDGVDLVDSPGTTSGLFESAGGKRMKTKKPKAGPRIKLDDLVAKLEKRGALRESLEALREAGNVSGDMMLAEGDSVESSVNNAFMSACNQVLGDGKSDRKSKLKRLDSIMEAQEKLIASGALAAAPEEQPDTTPDEVTESEEDPEPDGDEEDDKVEKSYKESAQAEVAKLKLRESCYALAAQLDVILSPTQLKILERLDTDAERRTYLRESASPRKSGQGSTGEEKKRLDGATLAQRITGRRR